MVLYEFLIQNIFQISLNEISKAIDQVIDQVIDFEFSMDNVAKLRQESSEGNTFFDIDSVCLGNLNITETLHHGGIRRI